MTIDKSNTVAMFYRCSPKSEHVIRGRAKLQRRIFNALEDMAEDGFTTILLPIESETPFLTPFIDALNELKAYNTDVRLVVVFPYEDADMLCGIEQYARYTDEVRYNQKEYVCGEPTNLIDNLLAASSAAVTFCDKKSPLMRFAYNSIYHLGLPFVNINL